MKLTISHRVFSVILSLLVMVSTLSLTIEKHFCGDNLVDISLFSKTNGCGDVEDSSDDCTIIKKTCCKDEIDIIEGQSELAIKSFEDLDDIQKQVLYAYTYSYISLFENLPKAIVPHKDYLSPKLIKDIHVLDETYLI